MTPHAGPRVSLRRVSVGAAGRSVGDSCLLVLPSWPAPSAWVCAFLPRAAASPTQRRKPGRFADEPPPPACLFSGRRTPLCLFGAPGPPPLPGRAGGTQLPQTLPPISTSPQLRSPASDLLCPPLAELVRLGGRPGQTCRDTEDRGRVPPAAQPAVPPGCQLPAAPQNPILQQDPQWDISPCPLPAAPTAASTPLGPPPPPRTGASRAWGQEERRRSGGGSRRRSWGRGQVEGERVDGPELRGQGPASSQRPHRGHIPLPGPTFFCVSVAHCGPFLGGA